LIEKGFQTLNWSIAIELASSNKENEGNAQSLGIWQTSRIISTVIASTVSGLLLDLFQQYGSKVGIFNLGYIVIYSFSIISFILGNIFIWFIKSARSVK
jgi:hypothetical protein